MSDNLLGNSSLAAFVLASLLLAVTPGPGVVYIVTRTLAQGRRAGLASVAGVALGNLGNASAAALGLAALFAVSALAFSVVKYAGAAYLIYLGIRLLMSEAAASGKAYAAAAPGSVFRDGFVVALLNPKTTLFFAAFLPQFVDPAAPPLQQSLLLGALFVLIALITDSLYVLAASAAHAALTTGKRVQRAGRRLGAAVLIGLGVLAAASGRADGK